MTKREEQKYLTTPEQVAKVLANAVVRSCEEHPDAFVLDILDKTIGYLVDIYTLRLDETGEDDEQ